jgi:hypothetical protein
MRKLVTLLPNASLTDKGERVIRRLGVLDTQCPVWASALASGAELGKFDFRTQYTAKRRVVADVIYSGNCAWLSGTRHRVGGQRVRDAGMCAPSGSSGRRTID